MKTFMAIIVLFLFHSGGMAQNENIQVKTQHNIQKHALSLKTSQQIGYVFATNDFVRGINAEKEQIYNLAAFSAQLSKQTTGEKLWEQLYNLPAWGIGFYYAHYENHEEIGQPISVYGFFNAPFVRWEKWSFNYELSFGGSFNWNPYHPAKNPYNIAIGANQSFFIDAGLMFVQHITPKLDVEYGLNLTHFSNGALKLPNKGLNTIATKVSLKYNFYDRIETNWKVKPEFKKRNDIELAVFGARKNMVYELKNLDEAIKKQGLDYAILGFSALFNRQLSFKSKIGIGASVSYNPSVNRNVEVIGNTLQAQAKNNADFIELSVFPSYELVVHKVSLVLQPAFYVYRHKENNSTPVFHQRIGLKYRFADNLFAGITLRDYDFHVSDYIEWRVGYVF